MRCRTLRSGAILVAFALSSSAFAAQAQAPPLPRLPLDAYADQTREAVAPVYKNAVDRPADAQAAGALGRALQAWDQFEDAHQTYLRAQALAPTAFEWLYLDAVVLYRLARYEEATGQFRRALALSPDYLPARIKLADATIRAGRLDEAREMFEALRSGPLTQPFAEYGLGLIAAGEGRHEAAINHLQRAIELFPEWGEAHYALALSYNRLGRREDAERAMAARLQHGASGPGLEDPVLATTSTVRDDAIAALQRGIKLDQDGDRAGAIAAHEEAVTGDPSFAQAHLNLILLYGRAANWAKVEEHYRKAVALGYSLADVHYNYGYAQQLQGHWDQAEAAYRRALGSNPHHFRAHLNLAATLERRKDLEGAAAEFRLAADAEPTSRSARFYLGRVLLELQRSQEAITELEKILEPRDVEAATYLHALAIAYAEAGNAKTAIARAMEARELALSHRQMELVAAIDQTLAYLKGSPR
jgi:tetratricopeptide (TPR) repeat protein